MTWIEASCVFHGQHYSPCQVEKQTNLSFVTKNEPGEAGSFGKFKGKPTPFGSSTLVPPRQMTKDNADYGTEWLVDVVIKEKKQFEAAGVSDMTLRLSVYHDGQCNLEFAESLLKKLAASSVVLTLSCYEDADYVQKKIGEAEAAENTGAGEPEPTSPPR